MGQPKPILVTGASTGIGRKLTEYLARNGCFVYAGARKQRDLEALAAIPNVQPLRLDVTRLNEIETAAKRVAGQGRGLYGLVNNAGIVTMGPVAGGDDAEFDLTMKVNAYGPYRVTRSFLRSIVAARGRIVMISSVAGILAERNVSAYSMSKHAIEAFTDSLAAEVEPLGAHVSVVEPGTFHTEIGNNAAARIGSAGTLPDFSKFPEPDPVVEAITLALFEPQPKRRYLVAPSEHEVASTIRKQIEQLIELNAAHRYSYDRHTLIRLMDEALAGARSPVECGTAAPAANHL